MGVRDAVGVADSAAMNVARRAVMVAWVASCGSSVGVREGVDVEVNVRTAVIVGLRLGNEVFVGDRTRAGVIVPVETDVRERICLTMGSPNSKEPIAKEASARLTTSSCQPAVIRARRVR
jgi:hypothetical protein